MISNLLANGIINKWRLLLENYKSVGLSEDELVLVMLIMHTSSIDKRFVTPMEISKYSNFSSKKIDGLLANLKKKQYISLTNKKNKLEMDLSPLFKKILISIENAQNNIERKDIYQGIDAILLNSMYQLEKNAVNDLLEKQISEFQMIEIINSFDDKKVSFDEFLKKVNNYIKNKPKTLTKYNWLTD